MSFTSKLLLVNSGSLSSGDSEAISGTRSPVGGSPPSGVGNYVNVEVGNNLNVFVKH
jgi:hypothetical protein